VTTKIIGYVRLDTDETDLKGQETEIRAYAHTRGLAVTEVIQGEYAVSGRDAVGMRTAELTSKLREGDTLLVTALSRLGRNMLQALDLLDQLARRGVFVVFLRQPALSISPGNVDQMLPILREFAVAEQEFISIRTKLGLAAAKAQGKLLGRPKGRKNRTRVLDPHKDEIRNLLTAGVSLASIVNLVNQQFERSLAYNTYKYYVQNDDELRELWLQQRQARAPG
jgi:DNA invertase Pin-like site-specific DNA recombinase